MAEKKWNNFEIKNKKNIDKAWIFKNKEKKELESNIIDAVKKLNSKLTKKEIIHLMRIIETSAWLDWLKNELSEKHVLWTKKIPDDVLKSIIDLINKAKEISKSWIDNLKIEINILNKSKEYDINKNVYFSSKFNWIKKYEESKLWDNLKLDIGWIFIWLSDSALIIFKFLFWIIKDIAFLPKQIIYNLKNK